MGTARCLFSVAAVGFTLLGCSPYHRQLRAGRRLYRTLHREVREGDSRERVESLIGPGSPGVGGKTLDKLQRDIAQRHPEMFPGGIEDNDVLLYWRVGDSGGFILLQFRNGRLVNFDHNEYAEYHVDRLGG